MSKALLEFNRLASLLVNAPAKKSKIKKAVFEKSIPFSTAVAKETAQPLAPGIINPSVAAQAEATVVTPTSHDSLNDLALVDFAKLDPEHEKVQEICLEVALEIAKDGEGGLIVIGDNIKYEKHFPNFFEGQQINVKDHGMNKVLKKLAEIDGAVVVNPNGTIQAYGVRILEQSAQAGNGTRHSAGMGVSKDPRVLAILCSEEDKKVKIFRNQKQIAQINPFTKGVEDNLHKVVNFINRPEALIVAGSAIAAPLLGIALLPGIIIFSGSYYVAKNIFKFTQQSQQRAAEKKSYKLTRIPAMNLNRPEMPKP